MRSSTSSVKRWPDRNEVDRAVRAWARDIESSYPDVERVGYGGSYARGDWGFGSDVDIVIILSSSDVPFIERARRFDATRLPVPADVLVYTVREWDALDSRRMHPVVWASINEQRSA